MIPQLLNPSLKEGFSSWSLSLELGGFSSWSLSLGLYSAVHDKQVTNNQTNSSLPPCQIIPENTGDWSDRATSIPGWNVVVYPQPGDVIAYNGLPAIVVSQNTSVTVLGRCVVASHY